MPKFFELSQEEKTKMQARTVFIRQLDTKKTEEELELWLREQLGGLGFSQITMPLPERSRKTKNRTNRGIAFVVMNSKEDVPQAQSLLHRKKFGSRVILARQETQEEKTKHEYEENRRKAAEEALNRKYSSKPTTEYGRYRVPSPWADLESRPEMDPLHPMFWEECGPEVWEARRRNEDVKQNPRRYRLREEELQKRRRTVSEAGVTGKKRAMESKAAAIKKRRVEASRKPTKKEEKEPVFDLQLYKDLDDKDTEIVEIAFGGHEDDVVVTMGQQKISTGQLKCLRGGEHVNDTIMNAFWKIIEEEMRAKNKPVLFFNCFFYSRLYSEDKFHYKGVRRWTKRQKMEKFFHDPESGAKCGTIFDLDQLVFPVKFGKESPVWCTAVINFEEKLIELYNPESTPKWEETAQQFFGVLRMYLEAEFKDKIVVPLQEKEGRHAKIPEFRVNDWANFLPSANEIPQLESPCDSGIFAMLYCYCKARAVPFDYTPKQIETVRQRVAHLLKTRSDE